MGIDENHLLIPDQIANQPGPQLVYSKGVDLFDQAPLNLRSIR